MFLISVILQALHPTIKAIGHYFANNPAYVLKSGAKLLKFVFRVATATPSHRTRMPKKRFHSQGFIRKDN